MWAYDAIKMASDDQNPRSFEESVNMYGTKRCITLTVYRETTGKWYTLAKVNNCFRRSVTSPENTASPANIGHLVPSELHQGIRHPLHTLGIWCPSELHQGVRHPLQTLGIWCPNELHWGIRHPLQTLGIWCP